MRGGEEKDVFLWLTKKSPQKLRAPNAYNLFVKEFFKSVGKLSVLITV